MRHASITPIWFHTLSVGRNSLTVVLITLIVMQYFAMVNLHVRMDLSILTEEGHWTTSFPGPFPLLGIGPENEVGHWND